MEQDNERMLLEAKEIESALKKYIESFNNQYADEKIDSDDLFINNCVNKPGAIGCYNKNGKWYIYYTDDRFNVLVNGPFSKGGIITALATMLFIPSDINDYRFTDEERDIFLQGFRPIKR